MSKWLYHLNIADIHKLAQNEQITPKQWAAGVAKRIKETDLPKDDEIQSITDRLELEVDEDSTFDDTDELLDELVAWADYNRCWVNIFER